MSDFLLKITARGIVQSSAMAPPVPQDFCQDSWVLKEMNESAKALVEASSRLWYDHLPLQIRDMLTAAGKEEI